MFNQKQKLNLAVVLVMLSVVLFGGCGLKDVVTVGDDPAREVEREKQKQEDLFEVIHVFDGDTFSVRVGEKIEIVRAIGIDTPETGEKYTKKECFGKQSTKRAIELLGGKKVRLEADPTQADRDKYDRLLRYVFLEDGTFFNLTMIEEGFAEEYTFEYSVYQYQTKFLKAQEEAKKEGKGLWGECEGEG